MKNLLNYILLALVLIGFVSCNKNESHHAPHSSGHGDHHGEEEAEPEKGVHRGRLLKDGDFVLELAIFETGVPPEFRVWTTYKGQALKPEDVSLSVVLTRLGDVKDDIKFKAEGDYLRGNMEIYEPHSFVVTINAEHQGKSYHWEYDNFEGRTKIENKVADALEIKTTIAGKATLQETVKVYGKLANDPEKVSKITARYEGRVEKVHVSLGEKVKKGQLLLEIESNESLKSYSIKSPLSGVVSKRNINTGEQTNNRVLLEITDNTSLHADFFIFPENRHQVKIGSQISFKIKGQKEPIHSVIEYINTTSEGNQSVEAHAVFDNKDGKFVPGLFTSGEIQIAEHQVPLAVKRSGLQAFRDFTVVYAKIGEEYEVRMLELGRQAGEWVEVLGGINAGDEYVTENSYVIKADIEKSGAAHDH